MRAKRLKTFAKVWLARAATPSIVARALRIALIVGTILNIVNQGDAIFGDKDIHWIRLCFTYLVPYVVSTVSAVEALRTRGKGKPRLRA